MKRSEAKEKAKELVSQMTMEELVSQLKYNAPSIKRLGIPAYNWWNEGLHGVARAGTATIYPQAIALAAMFDRKLLQKIADQIAEECRAKYNYFSDRDDRDIYKGLTLWSPNINIFRDPRWGRGQETYGEDPYLTKESGIAFVKGLQGDGPYLKTAACAKHFAVHSGPEELRHEMNVEVSLKDMEETYFPAFEALVKESEVESVMGAYNRVNGSPCCGSERLIEKKLREEWGFQGYFVSDCWAIQDFHLHHMVTDTPEESAAMAINAGCDLNCGTTYLRILQAYENNLVTKERIEQSAERLMTTRLMLGMFDKNCEYNKIPYSRVECKEHLDTSEEASRKSIVLLKNNGILPLDKRKIGTIGVIGPNAYSRTALIGNYHGTSSEYITLLDGIRQEVKGDIRILYSSGCHIQNDRTEALAYRQDRLSEACIVANNSDVVILNLGLNEFIEGEEGDAGNSYASGDKIDLQLPKVQRELLSEIVNIGKPIILCVSAGSALDLNYAQTHCDAILQLWYPGARGGKSAADIIFGNCSPSGKLPITFYENLDSLPEFEDYSMEGRTYRYMREPALYPFGYGLTYGKNYIKSVKAVQKEYGVEIIAEAENIGTVGTEDVIQVYVKNLESKWSTENYHLCGFSRINLQCGKTVEVRIPIKYKEFTVVDDKGKRLIDGEDYCIYVGFHQPDERSCALTGDAVYSAMVKISNL